MIGVASMKAKNRSYSRLPLLLMALIPPALPILWGEFSEFNINFWFLPTANVSQFFINLEEIFIGAYYLVTPPLLLLYLRGTSRFCRSDGRFLLLTVVCVLSFGILRYLEYQFDTNGLPLADPFGNFYPLAFWILPLIMTGTAAFLLSGGS
jgi:hypothetical protein